MNRMHFGKYLSNLITVSGKGEGIAPNCPTGCKSGWDRPQNWSRCEIPFYPERHPQCYRSLKWRSISCINNPNACYQVEWKSCLHKESCHGEWSSWSTIRKNCSNICEGLKQRVRYCYLNGNISTGTCLGGGFANNQTDVQECTFRDCIEGRTAGENPIDTDINSPWSYTFYVTVVLAALILLFLIGLAAIKGRRYFKKDDNDLEQSTSFRFGGPSTPSPTNPTDNVFNSPTSPQQPPVNVYQDVEQETTSSQQNLFNGNQQQQEQQQQRPRFQKSVISLRKLPSLPRSKRNNARHKSTMKKMSRPRISSSYVQPIDARQTQSVSEMPSTSSWEDVVEPPYTRMKSFSAPKTQTKVPVTRSHTLATVHQGNGQRTKQFPAKQQPVADNWRSIHSGLSRRPKRFSSKKKRSTLSNNTGKSLNGRVMKTNELYKSSSILKQLKGNSVDAAKTVRANTDYMEPIPCTCTPKCVDSKKIVHSYECVDFVAPDDGYVDCYVSVANNNYLQ